MEVEKARGVSVAYVLFYANDGYLTRGVEVPFSLPIYDFDSSSMSDRYYGGFIDAVLEKDGVVWLCDHKTASQVSPSYWMELDTNPQLSLYFLAAKQCGLEPRFLWDVIVKPGIAPKNLTKADVKEINDEGSYQGLPTNETVEYGDKETPKLYGQRVLAAYTSDPAKYFHRRKIVRTDAEVIEQAKWLDTVTKDMSSCVRSDLPIYQNPHACKRFGTMCDFHKICSGVCEKGDTSQYQQRKKADDDRKLANDAISNSQIGTFLSCRKEWEFRYQDKIERTHGEYRDALHFGSLVHTAIEMFLKTRWGQSRVVFPNGDG